MFSAKSLALCVSTAMLASMSLLETATAQTFVYEFDPASAGGVRGNVKVQYAGASKADVSADLDFSKLDLAAVQKVDGNCTTEPLTYKWHIHVKWNSTKSSDAFAQCSKAATSNHYDPTFACGANSEHAETPQCAPKIASYACSPANYTANPSVCEKGDLSGKFGDFKLDAATKRVSGKWTDEHYPLVAENTPQWNIILHAVCGKNTPRIACALGKRVDNGGGKPTDKPVTQSPANQSPVTQSPSTGKPTTQAPATQSPSTGKPTTQAPATGKPTTQSPPKPQC